MANQYAYIYTARVFVSSGGIDDLQVLENTTPGTMTVSRVGVGRVRFAPSGFSFPDFVGCVAMQTTGAAGVSSTYNDEDMPSYIEVQSGNAAYGAVEPACFTVSIIIPKS